MTSAFRPLKKARTSSLSRVDTAKLFSVAAAWRVNASQSD
jgi:hypothetical protein